LPTRHRLLATGTLAAFLASCAGWTVGPLRPTYGPTTQPVSVPDIEEGQRFDLFVTGAALFGIAFLLVKLPIGIAIDDPVWIAPLAGPYINWSDNASCPEGTSCFGMAINVIGVLMTVAEATGLGLFLWSLFAEPEQ